MTTYLHLISNSRSSWNPVVFVHDQASKSFIFGEIIESFNEISDVTYYY